MEKFLAELKNLSKQPSYLLRVAEKIKLHNLPVIIFGAAKYAQIVASKLISAGVKISGFAVDEKYFVPGKKFLGYPTFQHDVDGNFYEPKPEFVGLPIYNFDELCKIPDKYVFVLGVGDKTGNSRADKFLADERITKYRVEIVFKVCKIDWNFISNNKEKFFDTYKMLADDFSKKTMLAYLKSHLIEDILYFKDIFAKQGEYFNDFTRSAIYNGVYVDCGAFTGDSVEAFINFAGDNYKKIFAIEADPKNFKKMKDLVHEKNYKNVDLINCGVWHEKGAITFQSAGSVGSKIVDDGDIVVPTDTIDNIVGDEPVSMIKMDIEGAELNALKGAVKTLERCRPILALSAYHRKEDLITLPQFIKDIYGDCKFYLRKHESFTNLYGLDLYVVPN